MRVAPARVDNEGGRHGRDIFGIFGLSARSARATPNRHATNACERRIEAQPRDVAAGQNTNVPLGEHALAHRELEQATARRPCDEALACGRHPTRGTEPAHGPIPVERHRARVEQGLTQIGKQRVERSAPPHQQLMHIVPLRHARPRGWRIGQRVALDEPHFIEVPRQCMRGEQARHACADDDGTPGGRWGFGGRAARPCR